MSGTSNDEASNQNDQLGTQKWVLIDKGIRQSLNAEIKRTGATALILQHNAPNWPEGLTVAFVNRVIGGLIKRAPQRQIDQIFAMWAALPDRGEGPPLQKHRKREPKPPVGRPGYKIISDADRTALQAHRSRTRVGPAVLLDGAPERPAGLTPATLAGWLDGRTKKALPEHVAYVLARYASWGASVD
jgi:hypothetical protein